MKPILTLLLACCSLMLGLPGLSFAAAVPPTENSLSGSERLSLNQLAAENGPLLYQSAGRAELVIEDDGWGWHRHRRGFGIGAAILLTAIIVTVVVLAGPPNYRR